jgi:protein-S-isoprenylcysteine O-methyltransferase Ste14
MYSTFFLCLFSTSLTSANPVVIATSLAVMIVIGLRIEREEALLTERFGDQYVEYKRTTGAIVPKLHAPGSH